MSYFHSAKIRTFLILTKFFEEKFGKIIQICNNPHKTKAFITPPTKPPRQVSVKSIQSHLPPHCTSLNSRHPAAVNGDMNVKNSPSTKPPTRCFHRLLSLNQSIMLFFFIFIGFCYYFLPILRRKRQFAIGVLPYRTLDAVFRIYVVFTTHVSRYDKPVLRKSAYAHSD